MQRKNNGAEVLHFHRFIPVRTVASISHGRSFAKSLDDHLLGWILESCLFGVGVIKQGCLVPSGRRSLPQPIFPGAYDQSLKALLTQPAASESESRVLDAVSEREYSAAVAVSGVPGDRSHVHTHDHDGSEAPDESPDSILSSGPKPLGKHRPPPPPSILSPRESSYPP
ncbi:hypothetical protein Tco_0971323 [Tanacetum coccineum]